MLIQTAYGQRDVILGIQQSLDSLRHEAPLEKLYIHLDKPDYILGDTIRYKAYAMDGADGTPSAISGVIYMELFDVNGHLIQRSRQVLVAGSTYGDFVLDPATVMPGRLIMRAYTRWLQHFGPDYFYSRYIDVSGDYVQEWAVDLAPTSVKDQQGSRNVALDMALKHLDGKRLDVQPVTISLLRRGKIVMEERVVIDTLGHVTVGFNIPAGRDIDDFDIALRTDGVVKARFPLREGIPQAKYDVQFLPESGIGWLDYRRLWVAKPLTDKGREWQRMV